MVYDLTLSYNPKKDICHGQTGPRYGNGVLAEGKNNNNKKINNSDRNNS